jgi:transposase-like protein
LVAAFDGASLSSDSKGQVLHGSATTTEAVRRAIQHSQESLRALARRYGVNPKTIAKWKARSSVSDLPTGPREPRSTALSVEEEAWSSPSEGKFAVAQLVDKANTQTARAFLEALVAAVPWLGLGIAPVLVETGRCELVPA